MEENVFVEEEMSVGEIGKRIEDSHENEMLNEFTAAAIGRPVVAGPSEGTVIGNLLVQAMAVADVKDLRQLRRIVENSFPTKIYAPEGDGAAWDAAYEKLLALMKTRV